MGGSSTSNPSPSCGNGDSLGDMNRRQIIVGAIALSGVASAQTGARSRLIGVWKLRSCLRTFKDGHTEHPFGEQPVGRIEYDKAGRMSALLMRPGRHSTLPPGMELDKAPNEELRDAVTGFVAYFGTYEIEEATQKVVHHVEASLSPSWVGTDLKRSFRFDAGRLILIRPAPDTSDELIWERESD
jgi:Lipocalin-like domain